MKAISGIYKIVCRSTQDVYIGRSVDMQARKNQHFNDLRNGKHSNKPLQAAYDEYGEGCFLMKAVETGLRSDHQLSEAEEAWIIGMEEAGVTLYNIDLRPHTEPIARSWGKRQVSSVVEGVHPFGYADNHRPPWHSIVYGCGR
jgi:group I intron endonuclease